jgi:predicted DnaQ family exonuclease/DinG family helicase
MGIYSDFVAIHLETTGFDPDDAEIVSINAIRVRDGVPDEAFHQFIQPSDDLPPSITQLTGITSEHLQSAPSIEETIPLLTEYIGKSPLVAHNAEFVIDFLVAADAKPPLAYDTLELSRVAVPRLRDHRLPTIASAFEIEPSESPADVARIVVDAFRLLSATLSSLHPAALIELVSLAEEVESRNPAIGPLSDLLKEIATGNVPDGYADANRPGIESNRLVSLPNMLGPASTKGLFQERLDPTPIAEQIDAATVREILGPDGPLSKELDNYEVREQQIEMAEAVTQAFNDEELLVCEAGTGTGKSLAYLIPTILWAVRNGRRVIISTNTKTLQEQLFYKDLPLLEKILGKEFRATLLKGRGNYVCMNRWRSGAIPGMSVASERERGVALPIATWLRETESGDISENTAFPAASAPGRSLWAKLSAEGKPCSPNTCSHYNECYLIRVRRSSQNAHVVVANHSLLFSDVVAEGAVLGEYTDLILDEAHNLEKVATDYLGAEISWWSVRDTLHLLHQRDGHESGLLARINRDLPNGLLPQERVKVFQVQAARAIDAVSEATSAVQTFLEQLGKILPKPERRSSFAHKERYTSEDQPFDDVLAQRDTFFAAVETLIAETNTLTEWLRELNPGELSDRDEFVLDLENRSLDVSALIDRTLDITEARREDFVYWYEIPSDDSRYAVRLYTAPLNVGDQLRERFFPDLRSCVMTSATLAVAGKFNYFLNRVGLTGSVSERVRTLEVGSPFDFDQQAFIAVPEWFPTPKSRDFQDAVTDLVRDLVVTTRRGALVLFTSYKMLNETYRAVQSDFHSHGITLLKQDRAVSRSNLAESFRQDRESVLFGTESFWQGVDVPGDALELLVIVRLPFAVPSEPLLVAQGEALRAAGKDPFLHMTVPEAAIRFRQGFGRLIRSKSDRGAVLILDTRVVKERFGRAFLGSLPTGHYGFKNSESLITSLEHWFEESDTEESE